MNRDESATTTAIACVSMPRRHGEYLDRPEDLRLAADASSASPPPPGREGEPATATIWHGGQFRAGPLGRRNRSIPRPSSSTCPTACSAIGPWWNPGPYDLLGKKFPDFKLVDMQGKPWSSQSLAGKVAVLHFWRTQRRGVRSDDSHVPAVATQSSRTTTRWPFWP